MTHGNGQDAHVQRSLLARRLMQLAPKARMDALLADEKGGALIRSLPAQDIYMTIVDVGLVDATELVQLSSPEQFRSYIDLAAWRRDRVDPREVLIWLRAARGDEPSEFLSKLHGLDMEVLESMFRALIRVHDLEEHPDVNPPGVTMESPEGKYLLEFLVDGAELAALRTLVNDLIAEDPFKAGRFFEALRWELPTELEEAAFRFRSARLADLGFPEIYEALSLYSYTDPEKALSAMGPPVTSEAMAAPAGRVDYVEAAFRGLVGVEQVNLEDEVRFLVNSALVAEGAEPGDPQAIRRVSEMARDYLQLGLEHLCQGDPARAPEVVQALQLSRVFQIGFSLTLKLKFKLDRLAKERCARVDGCWMLLPDLGPAVEALHRRRPLRALKVEGAGPVTFRSRRELADSEALIERAGRQREVFVSLLLGVGEPAPFIAQRFGAPLSKLTPAVLWAGVVAHALLDRAPKVEPVADARLVELCERWISDQGGLAQVRSSALEKAVEVLQKAAPASSRDELRSMVQWVLHWVAEEIGKPYLAEGRLDPKLVSRLPIQGGAAL